MSSRRQSTWGMTPSVSGVIRKYGRLGILLAICGALALTTHAQNTLTFSISSPGENKSVAEWGVDTAWPSAWNMRQSLTHMGVDHVDVVRLNFYLHEPLLANNTLGADSKGLLDVQLSVAAQADAKPLVLVPNSGDTDAYYFDGSVLQVDRWVNVIKATMAYIDQQTGQAVIAVEPFNEPDYWSGMGTPSELNDVMSAMASNRIFQGVALVGASTLNSDNAQWWYDACATPATHGSTHQLGGSAYSYVNFFPHVTANGDTPYNPELHSLAEAILGAEYGMGGGIWWGPVERPRGLFVQASDGQRLGYFADLAHDSAAAVYRAPGGQIYAFGGCFERSGEPTSYKLVSTDGPVYFNGIHVSEYILQTIEGQQAFVTIDPNQAETVPPLDGYRWKIVNKLTNQVLEVANSGTSDGDLIRTAADSGGLNQRWDIVREYHRYDAIWLDTYLALTNANSGLAAEVANFSLDAGASVRQWGLAENTTRHWYIEPAGDGYFFIRNANSNLYLKGDSSNAVQDELGRGSSSLQWRFVLANPDPASETVGSYAFETNVNDTTGVNHATAFGSPMYGCGASGHDQAIMLDGIDDYVQLPSDIANRSDITIAAWVKWAGGDAWQRIFDFGNDTVAYLFLTPLSGNGTTMFAISNGGSTSELRLETDALPIGEWMHVAVTLGGNTGILYINGVPVIAGQMPLDPADFNPSLNYIGRSQYPDPLFNGMMDQFQIFDFALSAEQIAALADRPIAGDANSDGTVDLLDFDVLARMFGSSTANCASEGDFNGDGFISFADFELIEQNW